MTIPYEERKKSLQATQGRRHESQARIREYLDKSGLTVGAFARHCGYGESTMRLYLADRYAVAASTDTYIIKATDEWMAAHPVGQPTKVHGELYDTASVKLIQETFGKLIPRPRAFMIYAPPGRQKTFVLQHCVYRFNEAELPKNGHGARAYYVYAREGIRPSDLLRRIAEACGVSQRGTIDSILRNLRLEYQRRRVLLILDEAQHCSLDCFEVIRELLDQPPYFSLLFAGSHDLKSKFDKFSATLEQWNSRIAQKVRLPGLTREEAHRIVDAEVGAILARSGAAKARALADKFIDMATVADPYERGEKYINIRTLRNSLDDFESQAARKGAVA